MRDAVAGIEDSTAQGSLRAFWWTVGALLEGIVENGLDRGFGVKQLCARIDLQIRRVAEGSGKVADRLRREVLYFVAICAPVAPQVQAVQRAFKLSGLIPSAEVLSADVVRLQPLLREAREQLAGAKDSWLKAASGRAENLPKLKQTLSSVHAKAAEIHNGALMKLTAALVERIDRMPASGVSESVAMEFATALLLAESAFENYSSLSADFPKQVDAMLSRLDAARAGRPTAASGAPMLDEMSKRAQERVLLAQVGREIQANLRHMEQVLDAFFRDNGKRADLATLGKDSQQIRGALRILGLEDADRLLDALPAADRDLRRPRSAGQQRGPGASRGIAFRAWVLHRSSRAAATRPRPPDRPVYRQAPGRGARARAGGRRLGRGGRRRTARDVARSRGEVDRAPAHSAARESLKHKLAGLRDDAELIGDADLSRRPRRRWRSLRAAVTPTWRPPSAPWPRRRRRRRKSPRKRSACSRPMPTNSIANSSRSTCSKRRKCSIRWRPAMRRSSPIAGDREALRHGASRLSYAEGQRPHGRPRATG